MNGLEISKAYFREFGEPMLRREFAEFLPYMACGLFGRGSECFGFDDDVSRDHDFEPGFCILLPGEDVVDRRSAFLLERAYSKLPAEYLGLRRDLLAPVGGPRKGVLRTAELFSLLVGRADGLLSTEEWLRIPEHALAEAVNGEVFFDGYGEVTAIRDALAHYPSDVRLKKIAGALLMMAQSGQYNYMRCIKHGESAAAQLAACEFVNYAMKAVFLLNDTYMPYYKWSFRAMRRLPRLSLIAEVLEYLITTDNSEELYPDKYDVIEGIASDIIEELQRQELTEAICGDLEKHAYSVNDRIADAEIRNLHVLTAI